MAGYRDRQDHKKAGRQFPLSIQRLLPIPIMREFHPLRAGEADIQLDLQPLIDTVYERLRSNKLINSTKPLNPVLFRDDSVWLADTLATRNSQP